MIQAQTQFHGDVFGSDTSTHKYMTFSDERDYFGVLNAHLFKCTDPRESVTITSRKHFPLRS